MTADLDMRVLFADDKDSLLAFERRALESSVSDPMEREMAGWSARWRPEALDHYLKLGWSFGAFRDGKLAGYLLAQPILFHRGLVQTLWIEYVGYREIEVAHALLDVAHRWARDKHLQCVLLETKSELRTWKPGVAVELAEIKSAKY